MNKEFVLLRLVYYFKRNGFFKTITKVFELSWSKTFRRRRLLYYVDLPLLPIDKFKLPAEFEVVCRNSENCMSEEEFKVLTYYRRGKIVKYQLKTRFSKGARLWLVKTGGQTRGMVWTMRNGTIEPYYFPMTNNDVHIFDNEIFKDYRGCGINVNLINYVLITLREEGMVRAYIETGVHNISERISLAKTYFKNYGSAVKYQIFGFNIMSWSKNN